MIQAATKGDVGRLKVLLAQGAPVDPSKAHEDSPLIFAVMFGHLEAARLLLDAGANVNHRGALGNSALHYAVSKSLELTSLLLERGADLRAFNDSDYDVLSQHLLHEDADPAIITRLIDAGFDLNMRPARYRAGTTPLMAACSFRRLDAIELLLKAGVNPNEGDPLQAATWGGSKRELIPQMLGLLVKGGIDANFVSRKTTSILFEVCKAGELELARLLLERSADPNFVETGLGRTTVLMQVCKQGHLELARLLLDHGADPNGRGSGTPLTCAEDGGHQVLVDLLLERGARPEQPAVVSGDAEQAARAHPEDPALRLAWGQWLARHGHRAAAAQEARAAGDSALLHSLDFENPAGTRWTFADAQTQGASASLDDARFPKARVTSGARTLPLAIVLGPACTRCDEKGEIECPECHGSGTRPGFFNPDDEYDCPPRRTCPDCWGLKYVVSSSHFGKGRCLHANRITEAEWPGFVLVRCADCGLPSLRTASQEWFACGVCGRFACTCPRTPD